MDGFGWKNWMQLKKSQSLHFKKTLKPKMMELTHIQVQTVSAEIYPAPAPKQITEPCTSKITASSRTVASSDIDYDKITVYPGEISTPDTNTNYSLPEFSLSTVHLSGSYLDVGSVVSLDDVLILPLEDTESTPTLLNVEKESLIKQLPPELPLTSSSTSLPSFLPTESLVQPASAATKKKSSDPFKDHLMLPEITNEIRKKNQRTPASISSAAWRKYYEDKEQTKNEKKETIRKRKLERVEKQKQEKTKKDCQTVRKTAPKRKKKIEVTQETVNEEFEKENLPALQRVKCSKCDDVLISDVEDDDEKNIGCDKCIRWYHLKCTRFLGLSYLEAKDKSFECDLCY